MKKIVLTGGGTAGHVTPNIALLPYLKSEGYEVYYIGSKEGMEKEIVARYDIPYTGISSGKLRRYFDKKNFSDMFKVLKGIHEAKKALKKIKPDVVFSKGGFVAVPVVIAAKSLKIPVICHESDITPGLANKIAMPFAKAVCVTFPEAIPHIKNNKGILTGTPIRDVLYKGSKEKGLEFAHLDGTKPVMLIMGGSQGSVKINTSIRALLPELLKKYDIIHLCGKGNVDESLKDTKGYVQYDYLSKELPDIFAASDFVITRAGSNAICEFLALNKPMLLIPLSKRASRGDQILNAESFKKQGFADVCDEDEMTEESLFNSINALYENREKYITTMKSASLSKGVDEVMAVIKSVSKLLALGIAILTMTTSVFAGTSVNVKVNDKDIDAKGVIVDGRTLVPVRGIFEELGYFVVYNAETKTAFLNSLGSTIKMTYGNEYFTVNDQNITPDVPQTIIDGRFMLPLRAVGEALNYSVDWDPETKTASISRDNGIKVLGTLNLEDVKAEK